MVVPWHVEVGGTGWKMARSLYTAVMATAATESSLFGNDFSAPKQRMSLTRAVGWGRSNSWYGISYHGIMISWYLLPCYHGISYHGVMIISWYLVPCYHLCHSYQVTIVSHIRPSYLCKDRRNGMSCLIFKSRIMRVMIISYCKV